MSMLMDTYGTRALTLTRGIGSRVWDEADNSYLDAISGIAVCGLGHNHAAVTRAITAQAEQLLHVSNLYNIPAQRELAERLCPLAQMDKVFFSNSGAEANEAAIKLARKYGHDKGVDKPAIIVMDNSFHGRTLATLSATGNTKIQQGFAPLVEGFVRVPFNDLPAVAAVAQQHPNIVAVLVEPIQGEGGVRVPDKDYLPGLRALCDQHKWLLMLDEIQTGNGRTGKYFAYQHTDMLPDVVTTAKGLGNGVPIGACLARGQAAEVFGPGNHGSTFGGNPMACSAALAVVKTLTESHLLQTVSDRGEQLLNAFHAAFEHNPRVKDVRGQGLMIGIELDAPCPHLVAAARERGLLINVTSGNTIRLLPTFIITDEEANELTESIIALVNNA